MSIVKEWVDENGIGHWKLSNGVSDIHVDDNENEIKDAETELLGEMKNKPEL